MYIARGKREWQKKKREASKAISKTTLVVYVRVTWDGR
jgi:hypothetical protein